MTTRTTMALGMLGLFPLVSPLVVATDEGDTKVTRLSCEYRADPLGMDVVKPRLSWVIESGKLAAQAEGVKFLRMQDYTAVYAVGSGTYRFQSTLPETVK